MGAWLCGMPAQAGIHDRGSPLIILAQAGTHDPGSPLVMPAQAGIHDFFDIN